MYSGVRSHWISEKPFLKLFLEASRHIESPLSWKLEQLNLFWQVVCLAIIWLGTDENIAFGTKQILPSLHDVSSVNHKKKQLNLVRLASVLLGTHENTPLRGPINLTFRTCCVNPKKPLKLVCLALVWLATHANAALGTNKGRCLKILKHANI